MKRFLFRLALVVFVSIAAAWYASTAWNSYTMRRELARAEAAEKAEARRVAQILAQIAAAVGLCDEVVITHSNGDGGIPQELRFSDADWVKSISAVLANATGGPAKSPTPGVLEPMIDRSPYIKFFRNRVLTVEMEFGGEIVSAPGIKKVVLDKGSAAAIRALIASQVETSSNHAH